MTDSITAIAAGMCSIIAGYIAFFFNDADSGQFFMLLAINLHLSILTSRQIRGGQ